MYRSILYLSLSTVVQCIIHHGLYVHVDVGDLICNPFDYGAKGDGVSDDTIPLQSAINDCSTTSSPGGTVLLPSNGTFLSFELSIPSTARGFALEIEGVLRFSNDTSKWSKSMQGCIVINGGSDIALIGHGLVDGQGAVWWPCAKAGCPRPNLLTAQSVTNLLISNLTFKNSPNHNLELYASPQEVDHVTITAPDSANVPIPSHNTDGIDVHGSPAYIHDCHISVGDDHVALHANDTLVERCVFGTGHGTSIGSLGTNTFLKNITVRDCSYDGAVTAVRIKADTESSGYLHDVLYSNLSARNCQETIMLTMNYPSNSGESESTLLISNVTFMNIIASGGSVQQSGSLFCSKDAECRNLIIQNVTHVSIPKKGWSCEYAHGSETSNVPDVSCLLP
jgi:polygalacturonase